MSDYAELVKALRETAKHLDGISRFPYDDDPAKRIYSKKMTDAAAAIEALQAEQKKTVTQIFCEEQAAWEGRCKDLMKRISELQAEVERLKADVDAAYAH